MALLRLVACAPSHAVKRSSTRPSWGLAAHNILLNLRQRAHGAVTVSRRGGSCLQEKLALKWRHPPAAQVAQCRHCGPDGRYRCINRLQPPACCISQCAITTLALETSAHRALQAYIARTIAGWAQRWSKDDRTQVRITCSMALQWLWHLETSTCAARPAAPRRAAPGAAPARRCARGPARVPGPAWRAARRAAAAPARRTARTGRTLRPGALRCPRCRAAGGTATCAAGAGPLLRSSHIVSI